MEELETKPQLTAEQELEELNKRQAELRLKIDSASQLRTQAQIEALAAKAKKREAEEEEERLLLKEISRRKRERELADEEERKAQELQAAKERQERERQLAEEKAEREKKLAELDRVSRERAKALALEAELRKIELELQRGIEVADSPAEEAVTLNSPSHPLSRIFGSEQGALPKTEIDTVESAREEAKAKKNTEKLWLPVPGRYFVDFNESMALQTSWKKRTGYMPNSTQIEHLLTRWTGSDIEIAFQKMLEVHKANPMGVVAQVTFVEHILIEAAQRDEVRTQS